MGYRFPPKLQSYIEDMIATGVYADANELIVDAVTRLRELEADPRRKYEVLKKAIQVGIDDLDSGRSSPLDMQATLKRVRAKLTKAKSRKKRAAG